MVTLGWACCAFYFIFFTSVANFVLVLFLFLFYVYFRSFCVCMVLLFFNFLRVLLWGDAFLFIGVLFFILFFFFSSLLLLLCVFLFSVSLISLNSLILSLIDSIFLFVLLVVFYFSL